MRITGLILAITPFVVIGGLLLAMANPNGMNWIGVFFIMLISIPVLLIMSVTSVSFAFAKTPHLRLDKVAKVASVISVSMFGAASLGLLVTYCMLQSGAAW
jgi:hypothetical protein